jgi:thymidylate synthase (FAD)
MGKLVTPEVYYVGCTTARMGEIERYLTDSGNTHFLDSFYGAKEQGLSDGEILCSMFAKLCYASLSLGKNKNITRVRDIPDNLRATFDAGHGSVFEHAQLNFIVRNCSRVFTHELVRHRVGTAFSQTSGRYVRGDEVDLVFDPILEPVRAEIETIQYLLEERYQFMVEKMGLNVMTDFDRKKQITSALRRILPNGQSNEIAFSCNLRCIRHLVMLRTARGAEWEIRLVFGKIYRLLKDRHPLLFHGAREGEVNGLLEITGMKIQPWEKAEQAS